VAAIEMLRAIAAEIKIGSQCSSVVHTLSRVLRYVAHSPDAEMRGVGSLARCWRAAARSCTTLTSPLASPHLTLPFLTQLPYLPIPCHPSTAMLFLFRATPQPPCSSCSVMPIKSQLLSPSFWANYGCLLCVSNLSYLLGASSRSCCWVLPAALGPPRALRYASHVRLW
jgi:hypothetical protein